MSLTVHLALVFHVFIAAAIMGMVCGRHGIGPQKSVGLPFYYCIIALASLV